MSFFSRVPLEVHALFPQMHPPYVRLVRASKRGRTGRRSYCPFSLSLVIMSLASYFLEEEHCDAGNGAEVGRGGAGKERDNSDVYSELDKAKYLRSGWFSQLS